MEIDRSNKGLLAPERRCHSVVDLSLSLLRYQMPHEAGASLDDLVVHSTHFM